jgi:hypothetical protein
MISFHRPGGGPKVGRQGTRVDGQAAARCPAGGSARAQQLLCVNRRVEIAFPHSPRGSSCNASPPPYCSPPSSEAAARRVTAVSLHPQRRPQLSRATYRTRRQLNRRRPNPRRPNRHHRQTSSRQSQDPQRNPHRRRSLNRSDQRHQGQDLHRMKMTISFRRREICPAPALAAVHATTIRKRSSRSEIGRRRKFPRSCEPVALAAMKPTLMRCRAVAVGRFPVCRSKQTTPRKQRRRTEDA